MKYMTYPYGKREALTADYIIASYQVYGLTPDKVIDKIGGFAVGQTVGTWVKVPGITDEMMQKYQARVIEVEMTGSEPEYTFFVKVAFPVANFGGSFSSMLTGLLGNDVSTSLQVKLVDIEFTSKAAVKMGYKKKKQAPIEKLRTITGVTGRPLILNMIKPCVGFSPETGAGFFKEVALGGVDLIKDDELLTSPEYSPVEKRVEAYQKAAKKAFEKTGKYTTYMPNVTDRPQKMREHVKNIIDLGAKACLINFVFTGMDAFAEICREFGDDLFIMGHYAGLGVMNGDRSGMKNAVYLGTLARAAGADAVMTMFNGNADGLEKMDYYQNVQAQICEWPEVDKIVTTVGGGINPNYIPKIVEDLGNDIIIGVGGAIQGHPMGPTEGAKAVMRAVTSVQEGMTLKEAAQDCEALKQALELWG